MAQLGLSGLSDALQEPKSSSLKFPLYERGHPVGVLSDPAEYKVDWVRCWPRGEASARRSW